MIKRILKNNKTIIYIYSKFLKKEFASFLERKKEYICLTFYKDSRLFSLYKYYFYKYGFDIKQFFIYRLYDMSEVKVDSYISMRRRSLLFRKSDEKELLHIMANKKDFFDEYKDYMSKDVCFSRGNEKNVFWDFCQKNKEIVIKPIDGEKGKNIERLLIDSPEVIDYAWSKCQNGSFFIEKAMFNCPELASFHTKSLNTIRVATAIDGKGNAHIFAATLRTGTGNNCVDNGSHFGVFASIDVDSGEANSFGFNSKGQSFIRHPDSKLIFPGFVVPKWAELLSIAKIVALKNPGLRYIGWDYVLNEQYQWILLEGNEPGGVDILQLPLGKGLFFDISNILDK